jgi:predicted nuclease with TOPRIM domain
MMITRRLVTLLTIALLTISVPAIAAAAPGEHNHSQPMPTADWKSYPADIQALKAQLDNIRTEQKALFEQIKSQHEQIRAARKTLTSAQRYSLKKEAKQLVEKMRTSRDDIHVLRNQKHEVWDSFLQHAEGKQWSSARSDMETIVKQKKQIFEKQQGILQLQKQLLVLINPSSQTHVHSEK